MLLRNACLIGEREDSDASITWLSGQWMHDNVSDLVSEFAINKGRDDAQSNAIKSNKQLTICNHISSGCPLVITWTAVRPFKYETTCHT